MLEALKLLAKLQEVDSDIDACEKLINEKPESLRKLQDAETASAAALSSAKDALKKAEIARMDKESQVKSAEEKISHLKGQQFEVKTNEAYKALLNELADLDVKKSNLETKVLVVMEELDGLKAEIAKGESAQKAVSAKVSAALAAYEEEVKRRRVELEGLRIRRKEMSSVIEPRLLSVYERVRAARDGVAVVPIRNDACSGCFSQLRPQRMNELLMGDEIIRCERCARILYVAPDEEK